MSLFATVFALVSVGGCARTAVPVTAPNLRSVSTDSVVYRRMVARARGGDTTIDFAVIRFLFARLPSPSPRVPAESLFIRASRAPNNATARIVLDSMFDDWYGSSFAHSDALRLLQERGDTVGALKEAEVFERFLRSFGAGPGAGLTLESPLDVVSVREEYLYIRARGYTFGGIQADMLCPHGECDEMPSVETKTGKQVTLYFRWVRTGDR